ncbi:hypothetical protein ACQP2U_43660 (plasmid) [Nocardia sp. CA-084685]|uniref:hypothetical protein n=1 Tax=Nocardia sp. CA-084685 TaxID=3239970 RepID=UPI003D989161
MTRAAVFRPAARADLPRLELLESHPDEPSTYYVRDALDKAAKALVHTQQLSDLLAVAVGGVTEWRNR